MGSRPDRNRNLRYELRQLFAKAKMPSNPALAARLLELIKDPKSNAADFGAVIRADPALSARLLKTANSVPFAQRHAVTRIERAITVLGLNRVKTISLGFQLVGHLDRLGGAPFDMRTFWQRSLLRACLARSIAQTVVPKHAEEAFLVGLLQECTIPLLVQVLDGSYATLYNSANLSPTAFYAVEERSFPYTHVQALSVLACEWNLPKIIAVPLERHHQQMDLPEEPSEVERLSAVSYFVGALHFSGDLTVDPGERALREFAAAALGLSDAAWAETQSRAADEYQQVSTLYRDVLPGNIDIAELLSEANRQLAAVANDADQRVLDVEEERKTIQRGQRRLQNALHDYRERAAIDPLTNIFNRGALVEAARKAIKQNLDRGASLGALFIDIDNFKRLNDKFGHEIGDNVLKALAALLVREAGNRGIIGRYGGEEFVVVLRDLSADATREVAERIVERVRTLDAHALGFSGTVTCSLGAIWTKRLAVSSAEELFGAADQLMYKAKRSGKDRCCFGLLQNPEHDDQTDHLSAPEEAACRASQRTSDGQAGETQLEDLLILAGRLNAEEVDTFAGIRKQERKKLVVPCVVHYFTGNDTDMRAVQAATRNISTGGAAVMVDRPMIRGEAVEVVLDKGSSKLCLAGLVAFCRHIHGNVHEVGVQWVTNSVTPIIFGHPSEALEKVDWVARALDAKQDGKLEPEVSA